MERVAFSAVLAAVLMLMLGSWGIPRLRELRLRQSIREEAPARHQTKAGTPTMGGILILVAVVIATLAVSRSLPLGVTFALVVMVGYGSVGGLDDLLAIRRQRNLGLRARERLTVQILLAALVAFYVARRPELGTALTLPWLGEWDLGWAYVVFAILYVVGFANAVNLTDGLDGLAGGTVAIASGAYAAIAMRVGQPELAILASALAGACLGFVWFNAHPAAVIMGDVGSNALGAVLAAIAIITKTEITLFLVGLVFVLEAASVILQVAYFKGTGGKRLFRMSPLHHHFELSGWSETQTVTRFWLVAAFAALFGLTVVL
jgi:phospho-N-acetylmuramoyl-pentapeptide-transferase